MDSESRTGSVGLKVYAMFKILLIKSIQVKSRSTSICIEVNLSNGPFPYIQVLDSAFGK